MSKPLRIAQIMGKMVGGGVESSVMHYYRAIDKTKIQYDFIIDSDSVFVPREEIEALGGKVIEIPPYQQISKYISTLIKVLKSNEYKIVHSHLNTLSVFPLFAAKRAGVRVRIAHSHATMGKGELKRNIAKLLLRPLSNVYPTHRFACSESAGRWLFGNNHEFMVVPNAIDLGKFQFDLARRGKVREELGLTGNYVIGNVGRLVATKNQLFLLDLYEHYRLIDPSSKLVIVGSGPMEETIRDRSESLGISDGVILLGLQDNVEDLYQAFDIFVFPSLYEGFGMALLEAQQSGLPCVCSDRIPDEAIVSSRCEKAPLGRLDLWVSLVSKFSRIERGKQGVSPEASKRFDLDSAAEELAEAYLRLAEL